jgi:acetyl-CoA carboxylase biotin carboxylase subunit
MFKKILIANRGEIALRVIRTCREMGIKTVAVYSTADRRASMCASPTRPCASATAEQGELPEHGAHHRGGGDHQRGRDPPGLRLPERERQVQQALPAAQHQVHRRLTRADRGHGRQGHGQGHDDRGRCARVPGTEGLVTDIGRCEERGEEDRLPGDPEGHGRRWRQRHALVWKEEEFEEAFEKASQEAGAAFGNPGMYMEKYILEPRHIEIQIAGDQYGTFCHMSERDCSIQRRHQKLVEETPSPFMTKALRKKMGEAAIKAAASVNYEGRRHRGVPGGQGPEFLLHGDEHPDPGGAYHHRRGDRLRPDPRADQDRSGHPHQRPQLRAHAPQHPVPHQRGGSLQRLPPIPARSPATTVPAATVCAWIHTCTRATPSRRTTTA